MGRRCLNFSHVSLSSGALSGKDNIAVPIPQEGKQCLGGREGREPGGHTPYLFYSPSGASTDMDKLTARSPSSQPYSYRTFMKDRNKQDSGAQKGEDVNCADDWRF